MMTCATWPIASLIPILSYYHICPNWKNAVTFAKKRCVTLLQETPVHFLPSLILMVNSVNC